MFRPRPNTPKVPTISMAAAAKTSWCTGTIAHDRYPCGDTQCVVSLAGKPAQEFADKIHKTFLHGVNGEKLHHLNLRGCKKTVVQCNDCTNASGIEHTFVVAVKDMLRNYENNPLATGCPFEHNLKRCGNADCSVCVPHSLAIKLDDQNCIKGTKTHFVAAEDDQTPLQLSIRGTGVVNWLCVNPACGHFFDATTDQVHGKGRINGENSAGCPYCSGKVLCPPDKYGMSTCSSCYKRSVAYVLDHTYLKVAWGDNALSPHEVSRSSGQVLQFICKNEECNNAVEGRPCSLLYGEVRCPCCAIKTMCAGKGDCSVCYLKTAAARLEAVGAARCIAWADPRPANTVHAGSQKCYQLRCLDCDKSWAPSMANVFGRNKSGCPHCTKKTASRVLDVLNKLFPDDEFEVRAEARNGFAANVQELPFDFQVRHRASGRTILIELDGGQHFEDVLAWRSSVREVRSRDTFKAHAALTVGVATSGIVGMVRLPQLDVWHNTFEWEEQLCSTITAMLDDSITAPHVVYLTSPESTGLYDAHRADLAVALASDTPPSYHYIKSDDDDESDDEEEAEEEEEDAKTDQAAKPTKTRKPRQQRKASASGTASSPAKTPKPRKASASGAASSPAKPRQRKASASTATTKPRQRKPKNGAPATPKERPIDRKRAERRARVMAETKALRAGILEP